MDYTEFLWKLGGFGVNILLMLMYVAFRFIIRKREVLATQTDQEYDALRSGDVTVKDLAEGIWSVNINKVTAYASFGLGTVVLTAVFIYEQNLGGFDALFFTILLASVAFSVIAYFLSLQLWFFVVDQGGTVETRIFYRKQATLLQAIGWYSINMSIVLAVLLVNTWVGYIFSVLNMGAATYIMELKYYVMKREMFETSGKNDFQESLSLERIYEKNEGYRFKSLMKNSLKVLNWNIERGFSPDDILTYIRKEDPDIVALQEVDWENERTDNLDVLEYMANELNMKGYYSIEFFEIDSPYRAKSNGGGGVHGNAILTKIKPTNVYRIELPVYYDWENPPKGAELYAKIEKRIGKRFAICADFKFNTELLTVCSTHFEDKKGGVKGRIDQLNTIIETLNHQSGSESIKIIAGDMNTLDNWLVRMIRLSKKSEGGGKPWFVSECKWWKSEIIPKTSFRDPFTCKDWTHKVTALYRQKLDWILVSGALIEKTGIGDFHSSDHKPIWTEIIVD